jgi:hypothetical protein
MLLVILLIVVAIATGVLGVAVKGLLWLFVITALCLIGAAAVGRLTARR